MPRKAAHRHIPLHTQELAPYGGILLERGEAISGLPKAGKLSAHRDDHYIFILQEKGHCKILVDFTPIELKDGCLFFIAPGQVHHYQSVDYATGWFMALDAALLGSYRTFFENKAVSEQLLPLTDMAALPLQQGLQLVQSQRMKDPAPVFQTQVVHTLVLAFIGMAASAFAAGYNSNEHVHLRGAHITKQFRELVAQQYLTARTPADYARMLNLSLPYLNETVKSSTGFPVSYWIQQEVLLEAKRLLYYTLLSVKEIAYQLGYEDHAYFSRLFRKQVQCTPLDFRKRYRELSNTSH
jgi:AraC family transcriptional activator of pobA